MLIKSRDQNAERDDCVKIDNSSIERVEEFRYLATILRVERESEHSRAWLARVSLRSPRRVSLCWQHRTAPAWPLPAIPSVTVGL
jgi:hypothetical protein